jgi:uncharacterized membrane protein
VTISVTVTPSAPACNTVTTQSVTVTCTPAPTFTSVYAIIEQRCTGCHHSGGSGVTVGKLDMSMQGLAYSNLVGVAAQGTGAGTSKMTCASEMPPFVRVIPGDAANSLLFIKVDSKLTMSMPPCGSPMPPGMEESLTEDEVFLIGAWIGDGALNN